jgi:tripartite motif-containing protein 71
MRRWLTLLTVITVSSVTYVAAVRAAQFGRFGEGPGEFVEPFGIAVQHQTGDVYVLDTNNHRIERFTKNGVFKLAWGWGVADGKTMALQVCRQRCFSGLAGAGPGQLSFAEDIAIDSDSHSPSFNDLYVADLANYRVEKFGPTGRFVGMFGRGVNLSARRQHATSQEDRCPVRPSDKCGPGQRGHGAAQFEFPVEGHLLAVGADGSVYVGDRNRVEKFSPQGNYESETLLRSSLSSEAGETGGVSGLAVDLHGDMFVIRNGITGVRKYGPRGELLRVFDDKGEAAYAEGPTPVVVLDNAGHIYIDEFVKHHHQLREYDQAAHELATFDSGGEDVLHGITYSPVNRELYTINTNSNVRPPIARIHTLTPPPPNALPSMPPPNGPLVSRETLQELLSW